MGANSVLNPDGAQALRRLGSQAGCKPSCRTLGVSGGHHACSLGLDENVTVLGVQHTLADELLGDRDGDVVGHT